MKEAAVHALEKERFVSGESVTGFEEDFARYCGTKFAISTASGTAALMLALLGTSATGGEVVTTPASFIATANSILHAGASPVFADIDLESYTIDPSEVTSAVAEKTKAIVPVHLYGFPAEMDRLCRIASDRDLAIVEDACQAHGAVYRGKRVGSIGGAGCFSFYPSKNMTVGGDGGMVVTNDERIEEAVISLRNSGRIRGNRYVHSSIGFSERMNTVQAAIGRMQLKHLDEWNKRRVEIAQEYDRVLSDLDQVVIPPVGDDEIHPVYHMYVILCQKRDGLLGWLAEAHIECGVHYGLPIHLQPVYRAMYGYKEGDFPNSEQLCKNALSLPMHPSLSNEEVEYVAKKIHEFYAES
jgi:perosamine synthetase